MLSHNSAKVISSGDQRIINPFIIFRNSFGLIPIGINNSFCFIIENKLILIISTLFILTLFLSVQINSAKGSSLPGGGGYSHYGLTGGPVRAKEGQSKNFEKYPQMAVSFLQKPSNGSSRT